LASALGQTECPAGPVLQKTANAGLLTPIALCPNRRKARHLRRQFNRGKPCRETQRWVIFPTPNWSITGQIESKSGNCVVLRTVEQRELR
jgi:hypothetical protein